GFDLLAVVSSTDGSSTFIDARHRRFPDPSLDVLLTSPAGLTPPASAITPSTKAADATPWVVTLSPGDDVNGPLLTVDPNSTVAGITRTAIWRAIWHSPLAGLDRRAGALSQGADPGTLKFLSGPANFAVWTQDPVQQLAPGDVVALGFWNSADPNCQ